MILNVFEESLIKNKKLPEAWRSQETLNNLENFLQLNWEQRSVFYADGEVKSRQQFLAFVGQRGVRTQNYIGSIGFAGQQMNIFPKVFRTESGDNDTSDLCGRHMMKNLVQWLRYCNKMDYPYITMDSNLEDSEDLRELFITLYVHYVQRALDRGIFFRYEEVTETSSIIKGHVNFQNYFLKQLPNGNCDKFVCTFSNFEYDNTLNRIIKYTCKWLLNFTNAANQRIIRHILIKLNGVTDVRCYPHDCDAIKLNHLQQHYSIVLSMSKMFLLNKTSSYNIGSSEAFCFLFPTELLFEGFIGGFMQDVLQNQAKVRLQASELTLISDIEYAGQSLGKAFTMKHDILVEHKTKGIIILDTKYKQLDRFEGNPDIKALITSEVKQTDLNQILEYASRRNIKDVYLLYPLYRYEDVEPYYPSMRKDAGDGSGSVFVHLIRLPFIFEDDIDETYNKLRNVILKIFDSCNS